MFKIFLQLVAVTFTCQVSVATAQSSPDTSDFICDFSTPDGPVRIVDRDGADHVSAAEIAARRIFGETFGFNAVEYCRFMNPDFQTDYTISVVVSGGTKRTIEVGNELISYIESLMDQKEGEVPVFEIRQSSGALSTDTDSRDHNSNWGRNTIRVIKVADDFVPYAEIVVEALTTFSDIEHHASSAIERHGEENVTNSGCVSDGVISDRFETAVHTGVGTVAGAGIGAGIGGLGCIGLYFFPVAGLTCSGVVGFAALVGGFFGGSATASAAENQGYIGERAVNEKIDECLTN